MYTKNRLIGFLKDLDARLDQDIEIITLGGSALSLLDIKDSTEDIDFFIKGILYVDMENVLDKLKDKYERSEIDYWEDGKIVLNKEGGIVTQTMPEDYAEKADTLDLRLKHIKVRILNPVDIILTKVGRCNRKDIDDILKIAKKYKIEKQDLMNRFDEYLKSYDGSKNALKGNFRHVCEILYE